MHMIGTVSGTKFKISKEELANTGCIRGGLEIRIEGLKGDPADAEEPGTSVFLEYYEGKVLCHIWTDGQQDCQTIELT